MKTKGFTLVELLVVIAILAILATVSVVGYTSFIQNANDSACEQELAQIKTQVTANDIVGDYSDDYVLTNTSLVWTLGDSTTSEDAAKTVVVNALKAMAPELDWTNVTLTVTGTYTAKTESAAGTYAVASITYARDGGSAVWTIVPSNQ